MSYLAPNYEADPDEHPAEFSSDASWRCRDNNSFWALFDAETVIAIGTVASAAAAAIAAIVALYIDRLKPGPNLAARLVPHHVFSPEIQFFNDKLPRHVGHSLWFHVIVENLNRFAPAHKVQLLYSSIRWFDREGELRHEWSNDIPMCKTFNNPLKVIGHPIKFDLLSLYVPNDGSPPGIRFHPQVRPLSLPPIFTSSCRFEVTLLPVSIEMSGNPLILDVDWDGNWDPGRPGKHITVAPRPQ